MEKAKNEAKWKKFKDFEEKHDQVRTMDRFEQIHYFFQVMVEHNQKTLKSCELLKGNADEAEAAEGEQQEGVAASDVKIGNIKTDEQTPKVEEVSDAEEEAKLDDDTTQSKKKKKSKFQTFNDVLSLVIEEEERLPLWMMMTQEEKLDMLAHQCIDSEAQIMSFLIEFEYGAESNFAKEGVNMKLDMLLDDAMNQMIFQKYLAYTRLQASFYARKYTLDLINQTQENSIKLYNFAEYLFDLNKTLKKKESKNKKDIEAAKEENSNIEKSFNRYSKEMMGQMRTMKEDQKESAALAMKFFFEVGNKALESTIEDQNQAASMANGQ